MTAKQILNSGSAPDGSLYVTLTDGAGNLTTTGNVTIGTTPISGGATTQVLFNLGGVVSSDTGFTYAGSGGAVRIYNSFTDASNYERATFDWKAVANTFRIGTEAAGTGVVRNMRFDIGGINRLDYGITNASAWTVNAATLFYGGTGVVAPTYYFAAGTSAMTSPSSGIINLLNSTATDFGRLNFGGATSSFPALKKASASSIAVRLGDDSADASLTCAGLSTSTTINDTGYQYATPSTGGTVTLTNSNYHCIIDPAGTLATLTVNMPATPTDGMIVDVRFSQIITTLTVSGNGNSIKGNPSSAAVGSQFTAIYRAANTTWYI